MFLNVITLLQWIYCQRSPNHLVHLLVSSVGWNTTCHTYPKRLAYVKSFPVQYSTWDYFRPFVFSDLYKWSKWRHCRKLKLFANLFKYSFRLKYVDWIGQRNTFTFWLARKTTIILICVWNLLQSLLSL